MMTCFILHNDLARRYCSLAIRTWLSRICIQHHVLLCSFPYSALACLQVELCCRPSVWAIWWTPLSLATQPQSLGKILAACHQVVDGSLEKLSAKGQATWHPWYWRVSLTKDLAFKVCKKRWIEIQILEVACRANAVSHVLQVKLHLQGSRLTEQWSLKVTSWFLVKVYSLFRMLMPWLLGGWHLHCEQRSTSCLQNSLSLSVGMQHLLYCLPSKQSYSWRSLVSHSIYGVWQFSLKAIYPRSLFVTLTHTWDHPNSREAFLLSVQSSPVDSLPKVAKVLA